MVLVLKPVMMLMVDLTPTAASYLNTMLYINAYYVLGQAMNTTLICGIFRAGGDSRFGLSAIPWICGGFGVPAGISCGLCIQASAHVGVYFVICLDEICKNAVCVPAL